MCCYLENIIKYENFDLDNILIDKISHENVLIYISYKSLIQAKALHIRFDKVDRFIRIFDGNRFSKLPGYDKDDAIYNRIRYFLEVKSSIRYGFSHCYVKIKFLLIIVCL